MTAKRGTLWKTSWSRKKPSVGTAPEGVWWFAGFGDTDTSSGEYFFEQALSTPSTGDTVPPFWIGAVFGSTAPNADLETEIARGIGVPIPTVPDFRTRLHWDVSADNLFARAQADADAIPADVTVSHLPLLGADPSPALVRAVVQLMVVQSIVVDDTPMVRVTLWVDGTLRAVDTREGSYVPSAGNLFVRPMFGMLNSMAGGNALPTTAEIQTWFSQTRYASPFVGAAAIPGKTQDRYSASNTPGLVPTPLVNTAGGQAGVLTLVGSKPVTYGNYLVPTTFGY